MNCKIMLVGVGHMGQALVKGWLKKGWQPSDIVGVDPLGTAVDFVRETGITCVKKPQDFSGQVDVIVFAVKPQLMADVLPIYAPFVVQKTLFVSIAAGVDVPRLQGFLGEEASVVRAMPNMPASIGLGISGLYAADDVSAEHKEQAEALLDAVGECVWVANEDQMDVVTALSGSGPAYFFLMIESLAKAGVELGLSEEVSIKLASMTAFGSSAVAVDLCQTEATVLAVQSLRDSVTSPQGTTYEGVKVLSDANFDRIIIQTLLAAKKRAYELRNS